MNSAAGKFDESANNMMPFLCIAYRLLARSDILRDANKKYIALQTAIIKVGKVVCEDLPHAFFPEDYGFDPDAVHQLESKAIKLCQQCPVQKLCLDYAITAREPYGIWGGTKASDR